MTLSDLTQGENALAPHYSRFRVDQRLLLTGHSHQAWPDRALVGVQRAYDDAAQWVDQKWSRAFEQAEKVQQGYASLLNDDDGSYTLASNTHELLIRFLSALPLDQRRRLVTTDGEFHSIRRQLQRLEEERIEVVRVSSADPHSLAERLMAEIDDQTAAVLVSSVLFRSGRIVPGLERLIEAARRRGCEVLIDTYHHLNAVPFEMNAGDAFYVGGGYKYCQLGEGNCFLRVPPGRQMRPVITGWYAEFATLAAAPGKQVAYGEGASAFAGATYDPTSHYRGAEVFDFFSEMGLTPEFLRQVNQHQIALLARKFDNLDLDPTLIHRPEVPLEEVGAFLVLHSARANELHDALRDRGVMTDYRGQHLRFGPAVYLADRQLEEAMALLGEAARHLA